MSGHYFAMGRRSTHPSTQHGSYGNYAAHGLAVCKQHGVGLVKGFDWQVDGVGRSEVGLVTIFQSPLVSEIQHRILDSLNSGSVGRVGLAPPCRGKLEAFVDGGLEVGRGDRQDRRSRRDHRSRSCRDHRGRPGAPPLA